MSVATRPAPEAPGRAPSPWGRRAGLLVLGLPDLVGCAIAGFALPGVLALLVGAFHPWVVLPLGLVGALAAATLCRLPHERPTAVGVACTLLLLLFLALWLRHTLGVTAENLYVHRDSGTYTVTARWLMDHPRLPIPTHPEVFGNPPAADNVSAGFGYENADSVFAQGNHLLPAVLACIGWVFGTGALLHGNAVLAAAAMLVMFGLGRRLVGPLPALVATAAMTLSLPFAYVGRDSFTEPLALLLLLGGIALLHRAIGGGRTLDFALAGLVSGTAATVRIDSDAALLALIPAAALIVAAVPSPRLRQARRQVVALAVSALVPVVVGYVDLTRLASGYYHNERHQVLALGGVALVLAAAGLVATPLGRRPWVSAYLSARTGRLLGVALGLLGLVAAALVLRPVWFVSRGPAAPYLATIQATDGLTVDSTRTYDEQSLHWLQLYLGWPTLVLALLGYGLLLRRLIRKRELALLAPVAMGLILSALYLTSAAITPDQPWASRRFVPVVMPMLLIAAGEALRVGARRSRPWGALGATAAAAVVIAVPAVVAAPVSELAEERGQLAQVTAVCAAVGPSGAVVITDDAAQSGYAQTIRSFCGVPVLGLHAPTTTAVAALRTAVQAHGRTLYLLTQDRDTIPFAVQPDVPYTEVTTMLWPNALQTVPGAGASERVPLYLATARASGVADAVPR